MVICADYAHGHTCFDNTDCAMICTCLKMYSNSVVLGLVHAFNGKEEKRDEIAYNFECERNPKTIMQQQICFWIQL